ncbi:unnamed protein product [Cuscuta epithymum]|uniref:Uncharacterized protein n=1 Tax=Cuscuta epithymum TaxID=186058 RepID=A0AAV0CK88_9ASTE|nr:unnamed protein product [Cuscuta epithymum]
MKKNEGTNELGGLGGRIEYEKRGIRKEKKKKEEEEEKRRRKKNELTWPVRYCCSWETSPWRREHGRRRDWDIEKRRLDFNEEERKNSGWGAGHNGKRKTGGRL